MSAAIDQLYDLIEDLEIAMMTTRRADGHFQSRAMATQKRAAGADLWFVTAAGTTVLDDLAYDDHIGLSYYKDRTREWVSVSGIATVSQDRTTIEDLYAPDWRFWFSDDGDPRHGTADDPRLRLIGVDVHAAAFLEQDKPQPVVLFELAKALVKGETPDLGETRHLGDGATPVEPPASPG